MANIRAYQHSNRMIVHFFDTGSKDALQCPACRWSGSCKSNKDAASDCLTTTEPLSIKCPRCELPLGTISQLLTDITELPVFM